MLLKAMVTFVPKQNMFLMRLIISLFSLSLQFSGKGMQKISSLFE